MREPFVALTLLPQVVKVEWGLTNCHYSHSQPDPRCCGVCRDAARYCGHSLGQEPGGIPRVLILTSVVNLSLVLVK